MIGRIVHDDLHLANPALLYLHDFKGVVLIVYTLLKGREIALELKEQACQGVGISLYFREFFIAYIQNLTEITQKSLPLKDISIIIELGIGLFSWNSLSRSSIFFVSGTK